MSHLFHSQQPLLRISGSILSCLSTPYYITRRTLTLPTTTLPTLHSLFRPRPDHRTPAEIRFDTHRPRLWRRRACTRSCSRCTRAAALMAAALQRASEAEESEEAYRYSYSYTSDPFYWDAADPSNWSVLVRHDSLTSISEVLDVPSQLRRQRLDVAWEAAAAAVRARCAVIAGRAAAAMEEQFEMVRVFEGVGGDVAVGVAVVEGEVVLRVGGRVWGQGGGRCEYGLLWV